ncbi:hypothetical protein [Phenylobacterium sp.]|uniref:hypothetical protein n=1 Tax=Phenylobacterium sp. TaxID=1871053 RepID=UPI001202083A|nr:hypothetical protein [Phenylobacterium sp.]THD59115.1 MAG: hypothetical protein E8A49_17075 [Phenylobacterium sp.]
MVALSDRKLKIVRTLVETAPDRIVGGLRLALAESQGDSVLSSVRQLVEAESRDRLLRNAVFQPVTPLFVGDGSDTHGLVFPVAALTAIWRGLRALAPGQMAAAANAWAAVAAAEAAEQQQRIPDPAAAFNAVVQVAAGALRSVDVAEFHAAAELCDRARPGGAASLAACLDIAPIVRRALPRLDDWIAQSGDEVSAPARVAYKDAVAVSEDAGPRFFEMLAGQLDPPWMVLRIISAIMDKPTERYLAQSELGGFPERVMAAIDESLTAVAKLDLDGGPEAGRAAGRRVTLVTEQTFELETCIELTRDHGWGHRIVGQKKALASVVEGRLREAEKAVAEALPMLTPGFSRPRKTGPKLDEPPPPRAVGRAVTLMSFVHEIRLCANYGGFSAAYTKTTEKIATAMDHYVEEVLDHLRTGDVADVGLAQGFLAIAADVTGLVRDDKAAELVRRRAASASLTPPDAPVMLDA